MRNVIFGIVLFLATLSLGFSSGILWEQTRLPRTLKIGYENPPVATSNSTLELHFHEPVTLTVPEAKY